MLKMLKRLIGENIELIWKPDTDLWQVKIDPSQVDQIFTNLAVNAHDAIESHGTVIIETKNAVIDPDYLEGYKHFKTGDFVMFSVHDTGNGMDKQTIEKIFEPFYTTKPQGKGTGLGLSTVYGIVKQNNGFINVYSEPGTGTTFKIFLPRQEVKKNVQTKATSTSELKRGSETILLVEDEASILEIGKRMLEALGYAVLPASKPSIALEKSKEYKSKIDLLVTDVMMPEMNGRELSTILSETYPGIKTLYMSGYTSSIIAHNGILDDEVHFIQKPFTTVSLSEKVRKALSNTE